MLTGKRFTLLDLGIKHHTTGKTTNIYEQKDYWSYMPYTKTGSKLRLKKGESIGSCVQVNLNA